MSENVYDNPIYPDLEMEVRQGEREERVVDIYVSADGPDPGTQQHAVQKNTAQEQHGDSNAKKKNLSRVAGLFLGLLCVLLLAVIVGVVTNNFKLIKGKNNILAKERDELQSRFDLLENRYNNLTDKQEQLQSSYNNITERKEQLQSRFDHLTAERDNLDRIICGDGFIFGGGVCYYISTESEKNNWLQSNRDCETKQSQLMIIKSKDKQDLVESLNQRVWLGLTDRDLEGEWKWVDGTNLTEPKYWSTDQPDNRRRQDCVVFIPGRAPGGWKVRSCGDKNQWICEKVINCTEGLPNGPSVRRPRGP